MMYLWWIKKYILNSIGGKGFLKLFWVLILQILHGELNIVVWLVNKGKNTDLKIVASRVYNCTNI